MVKPRMIILIRHAQSEGNKNRDIHQYVPDHRVKLTPDGWQQAEEAGRRLRSMLRPDDTIQFYTSPYRRARETTEGILKTLTSEDPDQGPSPFPNSKIKVYEEPRLREQDFGNFQPCSAEMERMWQERADYGHFFYRIPNGESAADAYDRCSGFNESLWRQFGEDDFPSVCVLVTHGLMTRIFLMKWYHWSVEYFEDLRNINHCEFIIMKQNPDNGRYVLQTELRTWSDLKKRAAAAQGNATNGSASMKRNDSILYTPARRWGGCADGCNHAKLNYPRRPRRQNTADFMNVATPQNEKEKDDGKTYEIKGNGTSSPLPNRKKSMSSSKSADNGATPTPSESTDTTCAARTEPLTRDGEDAAVEQEAQGPDETADGDDVTPSESSNSEREDGDNDTNATGDLEGAAIIPHDHQHPIPNPLSRPNHLPILPPNPLVMGRDFGGSRSGLASPTSGSDDDSDYFDTNVHQLRSRLSVSVQGGHPPRSELSRSLLAQISDDDCPSTGTASPKSNLRRSGSRKSLKERPRAASASKGRERTNSRNNGKSKGSVSSRMEQEWVEESGMMSGKKADALGDVEEGDSELNPPSTSSGEFKNGNGKITDAIVDELKLRDRTGFSEIY